MTNLNLVKIHAQKTKDAEMFHSASVASRLTGGLIEAKLKIKSVVEEEI